MIEAKGWVIVTPRGCAVADTFRYGRKEAIAKFIGVSYSPGAWKSLYKEGFRCVRATLRTEK